MRAPQLQLLVDRQGHAVADLATVVGRMGLSFRVVSALPIAGKPPTPTVAAIELVDHQGMRVADPATGTLVGEPALYVHRLLSVTRTRDTRGL